jgi:hypothetical protein
LPFGKATQTSAGPVETAAWRVVAWIDVGWVDVDAVDTDSRRPRGAQLVGDRGIAVHGDVSDLGASAMGGNFIGGGPNHAAALVANGPIRFPSSSGIATIPSGQTNVNVTGVHVPVGSKILATLMELPGVGNNARLFLATRLDDTSFELLLTAVPNNSVKVAWLIIN